MTCFGNHIGFLCKCLILMSVLALRLGNVNNSENIIASGENNLPFYLLAKVYRVDSSMNGDHTVSESRCKTDGTCGSVQEAFNVLVGSAEYSSLISMLVNDSSSIMMNKVGLVNVTFVLVNDVKDFCGFNLSARGNVRFEFHFRALGNVKLTCSSNQTNFILDHSEISHISFDGCYLSKVDYNFEYFLSFTWKHSTFDDSDFKYVGNQNGTLFLSHLYNLEILNSSLIFSKIVFHGNTHVENSFFKSDGASFEILFADTIKMYNTESSTIIVLEECNEIWLERMAIFDAGKIFAASFTNFQISDSQISGISQRRPKVFLSFGESAKLINISSTSQRQVLTILNVKNVDIERMEVSNSYVSRENFYPGSVLLFNCDHVSLTECKFLNNKGTLYGGGLYINNYVTISLVSNIFRNNIGAKGGAVFIGYCPPHRTDVCTVSASNNLFEDNYSIESGGGLFILYVSNATLINNRFLRNSAMVSGGGLNIDYVKFLTINGSVFERNSVIQNNLNLKFDSDILSFQGGGGGIVIMATEYTLSILRSKFIENVAAKGGALLFITSGATESIVVTNDCVFQRNKADVGKEGLFMNLNTSSPELVYPAGHDFSTTPTTFKMVQFSPSEIYPGQPIHVTLTALDFYGNEMDLKKIRIQYVADENILPFFNFSLPGNIFQFLPLPTKQEFRSKRFITIYSEDAQYPFNISYNFVNCPNKHVLENVVINDKSVFQCVKDDTVLIITLSVAGGIALLIIGAAIGLVSLYIVKHVSVKMWTLKKKEKAEMSLEMRIIDKKVIFQGSMESSGNSKSKKSDQSDLTIPLLDINETPSFIIPIENIEIVKKLAEGGLGTVYLGKLWKKIDVAIKLLKSSDQVEEFEQEASLLSSLRHDNILTFYGICMTSENKYMITEFAEQGSLDKALYRSRIGEVKLPLKKKLSILISTAKGIEYLHNLTPIVVHRDLKPGNILLDNEHVAKICDFGLSRTISNSSVHSVMTTNLGTLFYCPSEIIEGPNESNMSSKQTATKIDVYSFAIIMWEVFFELVPYSTSVKLTRLYTATPQEEEIWARVNMFNIPSLVAKGLRPVIPFKTDEQIQEWISEYMKEENGAQNIVLVIRKYFELVRRNWENNATLRSPISNIREELEEILSLLNLPSK